MVEKLVEEENNRKEGWTCLSNLWHTQEDTLSPRERSDLVEDTHG